MVYLLLCDISPQNRTFYIKICSIKLFFIAVADHAGLESCQFFNPIASYKKFFTNLLSYAMCNVEVTKHATILYVFVQNSISMLCLQNHHQNKLSI